MRWLLLLVLPLCFAQAEPITAESRGYQATWSDEFDGPKLDDTKWHTSYAPKVHPLGCNGEKQSYAPENAMLQEGRLVLRAERKSREGMPFTSGMVASHDKFSQRYGWFEAHFKLPKGKGLWPAFWMLPQSKKWPPEIDIMELKGRLPQRVFLTLHEKQQRTWQPRSTGKEWDGPDFTADFHTFAVEWEPDAMRWYVDGDADTSTPFPSEILVDWVRVYAKP